MAGINDSDEEFEPYGDILLAHLNPETLRIQYQTMDDLFTGSSSKRRYTREPGQENIRLVIESELYCYVNFHVIPYLRTLLARRQNVFVWLAVLMQFRQIK